MAYNGSEDFGAPEDIEGRLAAHHELLVTLLCSVVENIPLSPAKLEQDVLVADGEEDPGLEPSAAFAAQNARAREMKAIVEAALARVTARQHATD